MHVYFYILYSLIYISVYLKKLKGVCKEGLGNLKSILFFKDNKFGEDLFGKIRADVYIYKCYLLNNFYYSIVYLVFKC